MNKLKIAIDGYEANVPQRLGSSQVSFNLIKAFEKIDRNNDYTIFLPSQPLDDLPKEREGFKYKILKPKRLWTFFALPFALFRSKERFDLFFSPSHYAPRFCPCKKIVTIFDLSYLHFPKSFTKRDLWQLSNWTRFSIMNSEHIITISGSSKKDIIKQYGINKTAITVALPGYNQKLFKPIKDSEKIVFVKNKYNIPASYIIYIGTLQPRKNLIRLMEAISRIEGINVVIVGKTSGQGRQGWMYEDILQTPRKLGIEKRVFFAGYVPDEDLPYLINGAKALIQPSLYEGFGIPVVEAMACGIPVLVSSVSSLPEVVGKAGLTFDPLSIDQMEQAIRTIITDQKIHQKLSKLALLQAKKFSWEKMARVVLKLFNNV